MKKVIVKGLFVAILLCSGSAFAVTYSYVSSPTAGLQNPYYNNGNCGHNNYYNNSYGHNNPYYNNYQQGSNRYYNPYNSYGYNYNNNYYNGNSRTGRFIRSWFNSKAPDVKKEVPVNFDNKSEDSIVPVKYPKISQIEKAVFGKSFENRDIVDRVGGLEKRIFSATYPNLSLSQRVDNIVVNYNQMHDFNNISKNALSNMERKVFSRNYAQDNTESRVGRLEEQVFGTMRGGDIETRFNTLKTAVNNYNVNPNNYPACTANMQSGRRGFLGGLANMLVGGGGTMTGFSPQLDPYNDFNNFDIGSGGIQRDIRTNRGWSRDFSDVNSSTGVTILD